MREYADELRDNGINVHYFKLCERDPSHTYAEFLCSFLKQQEWEKFSLFEMNHSTVTYIFCLFKFSPVHSQRDSTLSSALS